MFSAMCQGCHCLHALGKKLICAEKELLDSPGMAAENRQASMHKQSFPLASFSGKVYFSRGRGEGLQSQMLVVVSGQ